MSAADLVIDGLGGGRDAGARRAVHVPEALPIGGVRIDPIAAGVRIAIGRGPGRHRVSEVCQALPSLTSLLIERLELDLTGMRDLGSQEVRHLMEIHNVCRERAIAVTLTCADAPTRARLSALGLGPVRPLGGEAPEGGAPARQATTAEVSWS